MTKQRFVEYKSQFHFMLHQDFFFPYKVIKVLNEKEKEKGKKKTNNILYLVEYKVEH